MTDSPTSTAPSVEEWREILGLAREHAEMFSGTTSRGRIHNPEWESMISRAESSLASLMADAERLDWLESKPFVEVFYENGGAWKWSREFDGPRVALRDTIDHARKVDAARPAPPPPE